MPRKTLTVSEQAYNALARVRGKHQTLTNLILRLTRKTTKGDLLEYLRSTGPNSQLANRIEKILKQRNMIRLRTTRANEVRKRQMTKASKSIDRMRESSKSIAWSGAGGIRESRDRDHEAKGLEWRITVTPKGQIRIPAELMTKYGIRGAREYGLSRATEGLMLRPILRMEDWVSADAGKCSYAEMLKELDNLRKRWC